MERGFKSFVCLFALLFTTAACASWKYQDWGMKFNFGADVNMRHQEFQTGFGNDHFSEHHADTNFYVGTTICQYFGLEAGYEHMYRQDKRQFYPAESVVLGFFDITHVDPDLYISDVFTQGWHFDVIGLWPVLPKTQLTASIGIAWLKMFFDTVAITEPNIVATPVVRWESENQAVARIAVGIRQMITQQFGARFQAVWEKTSGLQGTIPVPLPLGVFEPINQGDNYTVKAGNSFLVGVGLFFQFA